MMTVAGSAAVGMDGWMDGSIEPMKLFFRKVQGYSEWTIESAPWYS